MGKIVKFLLKAFLFLVILWLAIGLIEQVGSILIVILIVVAIAVALGNSSHKSYQPTKPAAPPAPEPVKTAEKDEIEKLHVDMED